VEQALFLILAAGSVLGAANVVFRRNPAICAVFLVVTFVCLSGMFLLLGFPFVAAVQLMVYAGAIMVLFLFVVMLLNLEREQPRYVPYGSVVAPLLAGCLLGLLAPVFAEAEVRPAEQSELAPAAVAARGAEGGPALAQALFGRFLLPFEAVSILLLVAIIGVIVLAKRKASTLDGGSFDPGPAALAAPPAASPRARPQLAGRATEGL
jgi:NADH-quinone oxidoreductase subunit J